MTDEGRIKILDFGLARPAHEAWAFAQSDASAPTVVSPNESGVVLGTIGYMSPEQARGLDVHATSDIFSLGCVIYELVTGRRAFDRATATDTLAAVLHESPEPPEASGRHVPPELSRVIMHCLEKDPSRRFQSARDTAFALQAVLDDSTVQLGRVRSRGARTKSIAVLPFLNDSGDADLDYLGDGLTESLINTVAQMPRLRVIPRAVVFRYKGRAIDAGAVAIELNATTLVTGRVAARADQIIVQAEMVDVATDSQMWGQRYVRDRNDLFAVQEALSDEIAQALRGRLSRERTTPESASQAGCVGLRALPPGPACVESLDGRRVLEGEFQKPACGPNPRSGRPPAGSTCTATSREAAEC